MKAAALVASIALAAGPGCFGYNSSAKKWAYFGDAVLIAGGGAAIGYGVAFPPTEVCSGPGCPTYKPPVSGAVVAGALLVAAGIVGIIYNATRAEVKTSR